MLRVDGQIVESGEKGCGFKNIRTRVDRALDADRLPGQGQRGMEEF